MEQPGRLIALRRFPGDGAWARLAESFELVFADGPVRAAALADPRGVAVLWTFGEQIDRELLDACPDLRAVVNYGVGYDKVDVDELRRRGIGFVRVPGANAGAVADLAFALLLAARRRLGELDRRVRAGEWQGADAMAHDAYRSTLGIVGLGSIGREVARRAQGFDMRVLYAGRRDAPAEVAAALGARRAPLDELLAASDAVVLALPLTAETRGLIGARELALMPAHAVLVNVARGAIVDEHALIEALAAGRLAGAGLDVFASEPDVSPALCALPNVLLTPHIGDATWETLERMSELCADELLALEP